MTLCLLRCLTPFFVRPHSFAALTLCLNYRALLVVVDGIIPAPSDESSEELLLAARRRGPEALCQGPLRLVRATGIELFDTLADGADVVEHPEPGEVVWCADALQAAADDLVGHLCGRMRSRTWQRSLRPGG